MNKIYKATISKKSGFGAFTMLVFVLDGIHDLFRYETVRGNYKAALLYGINRGSTVLACSGGFVYHNPLAQEPSVSKVLEEYVREVDPKTKRRAQLVGVDVIPKDVDYSIDLEALSRLVDASGGWLKTFMIYGHGNPIPRVLTRRFGKFEEGRFGGTFPRSQLERILDKGILEDIPSEELKRSIITVKIVGTDPGTELVEA